MSWLIFRRAEFWEKAATKAAKLATPTGCRHRGMSASKRRSSTKCTSLPLRSRKAVGLISRRRAIVRPDRSLNRTAIKADAAGRYRHLVAERNVFLPGHGNLLFLGGILSRWIRAGNSPDVRRGTALHAPKLDIYRLRLGLRVHNADCDRAAIFGFCRRNV